MDETVEQLNETVQLINKLSYIKRWGPVLESDLGIPIRSQSEAFYIAFLLEIQKIVNSKIAEDAGHRYLSSLFVPYIRKLFPSEIQSNYHNFSVVKNFLNDSYKGLDIDGIISNGKDIHSIDLLTYEKEYENYTGFITPTDVETCVSTVVMDELNIFIKNHMLTNDSYVVGCYWFVVEDSKVIVKWF